MIDKLLMFPHPASIPVYKLRFPADLKNKSNICDALLAFIGPRSWLLFSLLKKNEELLDWMKAPFECWQHMVGYKKIKIIHFSQILSFSSGGGCKNLLNF